VGSGRATISWSLAKTASDCQAASAKATGVGLGVAGFAGDAVAVGEGLAAGGGEGCCA
jgi:hypothetical protein